MRFPERVLYVVSFKIDSCPDHPRMHVACLNQHEIRNNPEYRKEQLTTQQLSCRYFESNQDIVTAQACVYASLSNNESVCEILISVSHAVVAAARLGMFNSHSTKCGQTRVRSLPTCAQLSIDKRAIGVSLSTSPFNAS